MHLGSGPIGLIQPTGIGLRACRLRRPRGVAIGAWSAKTADATSPSCPPANRVPEIHCRYLLESSLMRLSCERVCRYSSFPLTGVHRTIRRREDKPRKLRPRTRQLSNACSSLTTATGTLSNVLTSLACECTTAMIWWLIGHRGIVTYGDQRSGLRGR